MEDDDLFRQPLEGALNKYTNVMKGWQYRWFVLEPTRGTLEYFVNEESKKQRARGALHLAGAVVSPSDEDSQTFMVNATNGEVYRLRAQDAKERQLWVSRLRAVVEKRNMVDYRDPSLTASSESLHNRTASKWSLHRGSPRGSVSSHGGGGGGGGGSGGGGGIPRQPRMSATLTATQESLRNAKDILIVAEEQQKNMVQNLEALPTTGPAINSLDHDCLLLKATSQATMDCLEDCLTMLQRQELTQGQRSAEELELSQSMANISLDIRTHLPETRPHAEHHTVLSATSVAMTSAQGGGASSHMTGPNMNTSHNIPVPVNQDDEVPDTEDDLDRDLGGVEEHKSIILHLLSQLKLGMDLTKVVLPTFILERRSLLEMFADFMALPHMFARIPTLPTPEARMLAVVEYYLCSFHVGRKGSLAKKPYNPILGETFHCSWDTPPSTSSQSGDGMLNGDQSVGGGGAASVGRSSSSDRVTFVAEQVSHHPPVSAFYAECASKRICMNAYVWTKSKFLGMSIGVNMIGECSVHVLDHGEVYSLTFPNAYGRSILTIPWMELGGKVTISCPQTNYSAAIVFHTKPFYGGKVHRLSAEVKNPTNQIVCRAQGEWNGSLEFTYASGEQRVLDTSKQAGCPKRVRPVSMQGEYESRRLWQHVTTSLKAGDINTATEHKRYLEERQRQEKKLRMETNTAWHTKLFSPTNNNGWAYNTMLK